MWPGDQHGGEPDPQQPNPYQQPGPGQPNPYQQPGQQPNPYQQPGYGYPQPGQPPGTPAYGYPQQQPGQPAPGTPAYGYPQQQPGPYGQQQWPGGAPTGEMPGGMKPSKPGGSRNAAIAIIASVAVIAAAVVTGVILLGEDGAETEQADGKKNSASTSPSGSPSPEPSPTTSKDPSAPVVAGWQTVINSKHHSAFDVPKNDDWKVKDSGNIIAFVDEESGDPLVAMSAPASYKDGWCKDSSRAVVGTKGAQGSTGTKEAAEIAAANWAIAGYDQKQQGTLKESGAKPFSNSHGIKGHTATATITDIPKGDSECDVTAAKVVTVSWINVNDDLSIWILVTDAGVQDEIPSSMIKKMMGSLRSFGEPGGGSDPRG